ncbi:histidine phosphatase family protein [Labrys monachus]|uniref:Broad specificity phosphatase PhoE n=1 Tax=Labrys monachus TaxID=217067 RepID=A0ABU0FNY0_9HYPH|nr:histidine phosphatase family protein [Labrys monachus]MDQ0396327.1 broad specificity phosphatase PhoE [Labrys monachus]
MTPSLTLICHAATPVLRAAGFPLDEAPDERGLAGARQLAGRFARAGRAVASPALRARRTAEAMGLAAAPLEDLRDCDYGRWAGLAFEEVAASEPDALAAWTTDPDARPHGGESVAMLVRRVGAWLDGEAFAGLSVAVTHASVVRAAVVHAIGAPAASFWRIEAGPLQMADLRRSARGWTLRLGA